MAGVPEDRIGGAVEPDLDLRREADVQAVRRRRVAERRRAAGCRVVADRPDDVVGQPILRAISRELGILQSI